ncbi:hypothetical protein [Aeromonas media]|uniref:hypothetical protein n=1 Tax=Aeromonas media TaxID=651 RepID=UPI003CFE5881
MPIIMTNCHFENNGTAIKAPTSADIKMSGSTFVGNGKAMDIYVSAVDLQKLGLPQDTPQEMLKEVISIIQGIPGCSQEEKEAAITKSSLFEWLGAAASASTLATALVQFCSSL